jgi:L-fuconolactonase
VTTPWIDAHHHIWDLGWRDQPWTLNPGHESIHRTWSLADYQGALAGTKVTSSVLVQVLNRIDETLDLLAVAASTNTVVGVVGWTEVSDPLIAANIAALRDAPGGQKLVGIRHQALAEVDLTSWIRTAQVSRGLDAIANAGLVYDLIMRPEHFAAAALTIAEHPDLTFVLNHGGKPPIASGLFEPWDNGIRALAALPNLYCKLSGLVSVADHQTWTEADLAPYAATILDAFGPDRVMFGSDWPVSTIPASYPGVVNLVETWIAALPPEAQAAVTGETARRVYRIA